MECSCESSTWDYIYWCNNYSWLQYTASGILFKLSVARRQECPSGALKVFWRFALQNDNQNNSKTFFLIPLNPSSCFICRQVYLSKSYVLPTHCVFESCMVLRTSFDYFQTQHGIIGFYNGEGVCLLRRMKRISEYKLSVIFYQHQIRSLA